MESIGALKIGADMTLSGGLSRVAVGRVTRAKNAIRGALSILSIAKALMKRTSAMFDAIQTAFAKTPEQVKQEKVREEEEASAAALS
jgi:hypothetical protein